MCFRTFRFLIGLVWASGALAQEDTSQVAAVRAGLELLREASNDAARDSAADKLRGDLRILLEQQGALRLDMTSLAISVVDAPDGAFRVVTFNVPQDNGEHRYIGFLLSHTRTRDILYELQDRTDRIDKAGHRKLGPDEWYGALYYAVVPPLSKGAPYTLLGWKGYSAVETRKVVEPLVLKEGAPSFGAPIFKEGRTRHLRKIFAYGAQYSMSLKYEKEKNALLLDHLSATNPAFDGQAALTGPDLSFDAYLWAKGAWNHMRDVDARNLDITRPHSMPPRTLGP